MPLKITLRPKERLYIGGAVLINEGAKCNLSVGNEVPILRETDILTEATADTPSRRIYFSIQLMYMDEKTLGKNYQVYWELVRDLLDMAPSAIKLIEEISQQILEGRYYQALKIAKRLTQYEKELLDNARKSV